MVPEISIAEYAIVTLVMIAILSLLLTVIAAWRSRR